MKQIYYLVLVLSCAGCVTAPDFSDTPVLEYVSISSTSVVQSSLGIDSILLILRFTDGDGNVGVPDGDRDQNITIIDNRTGVNYATFSTPVIPEQGVGNGVDVDVRLLLLNDCCVYTDPSIPACSIVDTTNVVTFDITIKDQDGNVSNTVTTDPITFICGN